MSDVNKPPLTFELPSFNSIPAPSVSPPIINSLNPEPSDEGLVTPIPTFPVPVIAPFTRNSAAPSKLTILSLYYREGLVGFLFGLFCGIILVLCL